MKFNVVGVRGVESEYAAGELNEEVRLNRECHLQPQVVQSSSSSYCPHSLPHWPHFSFRDTSSNIHVSSSKTDSALFPSPEPFPFKAQAHRSVSPCFFPLQAQAEPNTTASPFFFPMEGMGVASSSSSSAYSIPTTASFNFDAAAAVEMERARERVRRVRDSLGLEEETLALLAKTEAQSAALRSLHGQDHTPISNANLLFRRLAQPITRNADDEDTALADTFRTFALHLLNTLP